jgi:putative inorganic carbon (HCO3(-)) transporter
MTVLLTDTERVTLRVLACATVALAPVEGYVTAVHPQLAKVAPALLVIVWLTVRVRQRRALRLHPAHALLAALTVLMLASSALHAGGPFTAEYTVRWLPFLALTVVLIDVAAREVPLRALITSAVAGATVAGAGAIHSLLIGGAARATGPLEDPNDLAFVLVMAVPLLVAVRRGPLTVLAAVVLVGGAAATFSRGGALALGAAVLWLLARRALSVRVLGVALAGVAVAVVIAVQVAGPELSKALREKSFIAESNVDTRELRWQAAARMLADHPVLGVGPGGFRAGYAAASHNAEVTEQTPVAHNMFLEVAAELGLPAFAAFVGLIAVALVAAERVPRDRDAMVAIQAATVAVAVAATFLSEQYYLPLWLLVALAVAADLRHRAERSDDAGASPDQ